MSDISISKYKGKVKQSTHPQLEKTSSFIFGPHRGISAQTNLSQTFRMSATDNISKCLSFISVGRIDSASTFWQSSIYNSFSTDAKFSAKMLIPVDVRREHALKFIDFSEGAEDTSACSPSSERRYAPLRDTVVKEDKLFGV